MAGAGTALSEDLEESSDLGFIWRERKNGDVEVLHHGRLAVTLRGAKAGRFLAAIQAGDSAAA